MADHERVEITSRAELRAWLQANHDQTESIWLVTYKKAERPDLHVPWTDVVQEAICFGWIDSQASKLDDERSMVRLSPRKPGSAWSAINKAHVAALAERGLITEAGWAVIDAARGDGSWEFLDDVEAGIVPPDLAAALEAVPGAQEQFDALPRSSSRTALEWIKRAKKPDTRARRIAEVVAKSANGERPR